jgi:hypothetical protein
MTEREDGKHVYPPSISSDPSVLAAYLEAEIIRLGTKYGLTSKHTSYIAIDEKLPPQTLQFDPSQEYELDETASEFFYASSPSVEAFQCHSIVSLASLAAESSDSYSPPFPRRLSLSESDSDDEDFPEELPSGVVEPSLSIYRLQVDAFDEASSYSRSRSDRCISPDSQSANHVERDDEDASLVALARLQQFDGRFIQSERLFQLLDSPSKPSDAPLANEDAIATSLALVWMQRHEVEDGEDMIEKAEQWLKDCVGEDMYNKLIEWAESLFA